MIGLVLFAVGAILAWAVDVDTNGQFNVHVAGAILMIVGVVVFIIELMTFWRPRYWARRNTYIDEDL